MSGNKDINDSTLGDVVHSTAKGLIGILPVVGSLATELFSLVVTPPLEKRRAEWMNEIAQRLTNLEEQGKIIITDLIEKSSLLILSFKQQHLYLERAKRRNSNPLKTQ